MDQARKETVVNPSLALHAFQCVAKVILGPKELTIPALFYVCMGPTIFTDAPVSSNS